MLNLYSFYKSLAFQLDPEKVHEYSLSLMAKYPGTLKKIVPGNAIKPEQTVASSNLRWRNPIGLAAGLDKNAMALDFLDYLGFGAIEVGTVTLRPQVGNPRPRIWRMPKEQALRNAMGFPSLGAEAVLKNIRRYEGSCPIGINLGPNKAVGFDKTIYQYQKLIELFAPHGAYLVINISSPNTQGLRDFQRLDDLSKLLSALAVKAVANLPPVLLKISPDEDLASIPQIYNLAREYGLSGIVATNTTTQHSFEKGGVSGLPLHQVASATRKLLLELNEGRTDFDIIGVGGFSTREQVTEFFSLGGKFLQIYSSFIYQGPRVIESLLASS